MDERKEKLSSDYNYYDGGNQEIPLQEKEHMLLGSIGAVLGCLVGSILIILLSYFGYIASISGVVMGICALKGYLLLGKGLSKKGIVITVVIMVLMVFASYVVSFGIAVAQAFEVDVLTGILVTPALLCEEGVDLSIFYKDLLMLYVFTALGAFPTIRDYIKNNR